jgi:hypothetical protein
MRRTLLLSLLVVGATVALAVGAVSVMADKGGPEHGAEHGVATGLQDDGDGVVTQQDGEGEPEMVGATRIAETLAEQFDGVDAETVLAQHADGAGFGKLYKAYLIAEASEMTVGDVLAAVETDGFGVLFQELTDDVLVLTTGEDSIPKNLGQAISGAKKADKGPAVAAVNGGEDDGGQGPPDHAPAHGRP